MSIASGPIHHDLRLIPPKQKQEVGRLLFNIRMAQVCELIIVPVEVRQTVDVL